jgi:hypothetical protein
VGRFFLDFWAGSWPTVAGCVLVALIGSSLGRSHQRLTLVVIAIGIWLAIAATNWLRLDHFLREHSNWSIPMSQAWYTSAWSGVWLILVAVASHTLTRFRWPSAVGLACAVGIALLLPPLTSAGLLFVGCLLFGECP